MSRPPVVSVIVPTYQRRDAVRRAVASAMTQTFRDFELIVVDDGSRDGTRESLAALEGSLTYIGQPNRGVSAARNTGLARARGDLIAFLDSDDRWLPEHLAVMVALMRRHPQAVLASSSSGYRQHGRAPVKRSRSVDPFPDILTRAIAGFSTSTAARRVELEGVGGFDESLSTCEDTDLWLRLALRGQFALLARRTAVIERTAGSLSQEARRAGAELRAYAISWQRVARQLEAAGDGRSVQVRGALAHLEALRLLDAEDPCAATDKLAFACAALPALSRDWGWSLYLLGLLPGDERSVLMRRLLALSSAWPDRDSSTAAALRTRAALCAMRMGRPGIAAGQLADAPLRRVVAVSAQALKYGRSR